MNYNPFRSIFYGLNWQEKKADDYFIKRQYGPTQQELDNNPTLKIVWEDYLTTVVKNIHSNVH